MLGVDPVTGDQIGCLYQDAFTLVAEVIETDAKPVGQRAGLVNLSVAKIRLVHLVISSKDPTHCVGTKMRFQMTYSALMRAMAAPDTQTNMGTKRPWPNPRNAQGSSTHLALV